MLPGSFLEGAPWCQTDTPRPAVRGTASPGGGRCRAGTVRAETVCGEWRGLRRAGERKRYNIQSPLLFVGKGERNTNLRLPLLTRAEKTAQKSTRTVTPEPGEGSGGGSGRGGVLSLPLFWEPCGFLQSHVFPITRKITHQAASETYELNQIKRPLYQG